MTSYWDNDHLCSFNNIALISTQTEDIKLFGFDNKEIQKDVIISYERLTRLIADKTSQLNKLPERSIVMIESNNNIASIVTYLACLQCKHIVWFYDKKLVKDKLKELQSLYKVNVICSNEKLSIINRTRVEVAPELALLITTSGSTGSPTLVKLSYENLQSNSNAICQRLPIQVDDRILTTLPLLYSFGLSILNTHLLMGATIVLTEKSIVEREFWQLSSHYKISAFYGVPSIFYMLLQLNITRLPLSAYRYFAVAGGKLPKGQVKKVVDYCELNNKKLFIMYGQTEATARITTLDPARVSEKLESIGNAIPGGKLWLENNNEVIVDANKIGELCYQGPNVMMGLAESITDLSVEKNTEILRTGDIAYCDDDGDYFIVGRLKRFIKINGHRINLDEIEQLLNEFGYHAGCVGKDDNLICCIENKDIAIEQCSEVALKKLLSENINIHPKFCQIKFLSNLPILPSGKIDYKNLEVM